MGGRDLPAADDSTDCWPFNRLGRTGCDPGESVVVVESLRTHNEDAEEEAVPWIGSENTVPVVVLFEERLLANESVRSVAQLHLIGDPIADVLSICNLVN